MTSKEQAEKLWEDMFEGKESVSQDREGRQLEKLAAALELAWLKGWLVCQAQMVAAGQQFELALKNQSYLALSGPKSATQGVHSFIDGVKGAERPECVL